MIISYLHMFIHYLAICSFKTRTLFFSLLYYKSIIMLFCGLVPINQQRHNKFTELQV